ncbi:MAG TPA: FCD domain-containing protein [Iamia sp.]|nr:FCD domain-containing protein [Iamia sp.]
MDLDDVPNLKLERETLVDRLTVQLRQQILSGRPAPGEAMPVERELCEAFGVGRTTVREALHGLIAAGFLVRERRQLIVVDRNRIPDHEVDYAALAARLSVTDVFETRKALEAKAVELAARSWAEDDIVVLREALEAMRDVTGPEYHAADVAFHLTIVRLAKNAVLQQVYEDAQHLFFKLPGFWRVFAGQAPARQGKPITGWEGHRTVVDAIEARDAEAAVRANTELLDRVERTLIERLAGAGKLPGPDGAATPGAIPNPTPLTRSDG